MGDEVAPALGPVVCHRAGLVVALDQAHHAAGVLGQHARPEPVPVRGAVAPRCCTAAGLIGLPRARWAPAAARGSWTAGGWAGPARAIGHRRWPDLLLSMQVRAEIVGHRPAYFFRFGLGPGLAWPGFRLALSLRSLPVAVLGWLRLGCFPRLLAIGPPGVRVSSAGSIPRPASGFSPRPDERSVGRAAQAARRRDVPAPDGRPLGERLRPPVPDRPARPVRPR